MSDLFQKDVPDDFVLKVFDTMARADWHTFQVLTKRPQRAAKMASRLTWPKNVWLGTSIESTRYRWRADALRAAPAAVRFLSCEPLLGPLENLNLSEIQWVIVGGESGWGARRMDPSWARSLRDQCTSQSVAYFFKQAGAVLAKEWATKGKGGGLEGIPTDLRIRQVPI
jgi:protein gp37